MQKKNYRRKLKLLGDGHRHNLIPKLCLGQDYEVLPPLFYLCRLQHVDASLIYKTQINKNMTTKKIFCMKYILCCVCICRNVGFYKGLFSC